MADCQIYQTFSPSAVRRGDPPGWQRSGRAARRNALSAFPLRPTRLRGGPPHRLASLAQTSRLRAAQLPVDPGYEERPVVHPFRILARGEPSQKRSLCSFRQPTPQLFHKIRKGDGREDAAGLPMVQLKEGDVSVSAPAASSQDQVPHLAIDEVHALRNASAARRAHRSTVTCSTDVEESLPGTGAIEWHHRSHARQHRPKGCRRTQRHHPPGASASRRSVRRSGAAR